jgi:hypothetical protein
MALVGLSKNYDLLFLHYANVSVFFLVYQDADITDLLVCGNRRVKAFLSLKNALLKTDLVRDLELVSASNSVSFSSFPSGESHTQLQFP